MSTQPRTGQPRRRAPADARRPARLRSHHAELAARLTTRDRWLLRMLAEHRVLTTTHIAAVVFPSPRAAQLRLRTLYQLGVIDRFQPLTDTGSAPLHWVLDTAGATVLAAEDGHPDNARHRHDRVLAVAHSNQLRHLLGVNTCLIQLAATAAAAARTGQPVALELWWSQGRCTRHFGDFTRPDAYAAWRHHQQQVAFFLEYDLGTEPLTRLTSKLGGYAALAEATAITTPVLFALPTPARETTARAALTHALGQLDQPWTVPIATATPTAVAGLAGPVWTPIPGPPTTASTAADPPPTPAGGPTSLAGLGGLWPHTGRHRHTPTQTPRRGGSPAELAAPPPMPPTLHTGHPAQHR